MEPLQSWRSIGVSLVEQIESLAPYEVDEWIANWRIHNLPLTELSRALWYFIICPRVRENADLVYQRVDMGRSLLSIHNSTPVTGWAVVSHLIKRSLTIFSGERIRNLLRSGGEGDLRTAWQAGSLRSAEWHTDRQIRLFGIHSVLASTLPPAMPQPVPTFLPSLWTVSARLGQWWPPIGETPDFRLATRSHAQWMTSPYRVTVLPPPSESASIRAWEPVQYVIDTIQEFPRTPEMSGNLLACYGPDSAGLLMSRIAHCTSELSNRRLTALLLEVMAHLLQVSPVIRDMDQLSKHLVAVSDWLWMSRLAGSAHDERAAIWGAWGWFLAAALAFLAPGSGAVIRLSPGLAEDGDEQELWQAYTEGNQQSAITLANKIGDVDQLWQDVEDEALVSSSPAPLRCVWTFKPWLVEKPFASPWVPAPVRIMVEESRRMARDGAE
ncbi:MAG: hypothetical protein M1294_07915 [Firmicutes bacterium]|uniref:Uncharacterized protein n=1 Tax=Sulfobacillus benefaciens TaxID=453960 RepID=A0A2T2X895_9FIRM|nr:hypothetical protein [Bacillota bacterium]PSR30677.1 MAG: hypothetical protein C7B43_05145 [Sulfobacillus benefaciens]